MSGDAVRGVLGGVGPLFMGGGGASTPSAPAPVPTVAHEAAQAAGLEARRRVQQASGFASTLLTGGRGLTSSATTGAATLLGR